MTDYTNMTDIEIITSIIEKCGFAVVGTLSPAPGTTLDVEAFTSLPWFKAVQTPEGWDVIETTQEEAEKR